MTRIESWAILAAAIAGVLGTASGCESAGRPKSENESRAAETAPATRDVQASKSIDGERPVVIIDGDALTWASLEPTVAEAGGGAALQEIVLDRRLERELAAKGKSLPPDVIARERALMAKSLAARVSGAGRGGEIGDDQAEMMIAMLQRTRNMGETRFNALLKRNASLRLLVQDQVVVSDSLIQEAYAIKYGPKKRVRLIVVAMQAQASALRDTLMGSGADLPARFSRAAMEQSTDESASRGGVIEVFSVENPAYPVVIRQAAGALQSGTMSPVLALERGFGLMYLDENVPATGKSLSEVRADVEQEVRQRQERLAMDSLAASLIKQGGVTVMDKSLNWAWKNAGVPGSQ